jgi:hypothetical protein
MTDAGLKPMGTTFHAACNTHKMSTVTTIRCISRKKTRNLLLGTWGRERRGLGEERQCTCFVKLVGCLLTDALNSQQFLQYSSTGSSQRWWKVLRQLTVCKSMLV